MNLHEILERYKERTLQELREGPPRKEVKEFKLVDCFQIERPYFQSVSPDDKFYVESFRMARFALVTVLGLKGAASMFYRSGYELGKRFVDLGLIKSVDDLFKKFHESRIGLLHVVEERDDEIVIDVYECISGSGFPNIGTPVCHFEAGILAGILTKLKGVQYHGTETHCWATGYSACRFRIYRA